MMNSENLGSLLYYYIQESQKNGSYDDVDSPVARDALAECGGPVSSFHFAAVNYESGLSDSSEPPSPVVLPGGDYENMTSPFVSNLPSPVIVPQIPLSAEQQVKVSAAGKKLVELTKAFPADQHDRSAVKFKNSCLFVPSEKHTVSIFILRSPGCKDVPLTVQWRTYDKTALSGTHYVGTEGKVSFEKDETEKEIQIEILSSEADVDLRFLIELAIENSFIIPKPMTVNIKNIKKYSVQEQRRVTNLLEVSPTSASDVLFVLGGKLNNRMFHSGLSYLCSKADSVPLEVGLAMEFSSLCLHQKCLRYESVMKTLKDFFRTVELPDEF